MQKNMDSFRVLHQVTKGISFEPLSLIAMVMIVIQIIRFDDSKSEAVNKEL